MLVCVPACCMPVSCFGVTCGWCCCDLLVGQEQLVVDSHYCIYSKPILVLAPTGTTVFMTSHSPDCTCALPAVKPATPNALCLQLGGQSLEVSSIPLRCAHTVRASRCMNGFWDVMPRLFRCILRQPACAAGSSAYYMSLWICAFHKVVVRVVIEFLDAYVPMAGHGIAQQQQLVFCLSLTHVPYVLLLTCMLWVVSTAGFTMRFVCRAIAMEF